MTARRRTGSGLYGVKAGRKRRLGPTSSESPRQRAAGLRAWMGHTGSGLPNKVRRGRALWVPKRGRRKLGARRKITWFDSLFEWVWTPVRRNRRSRRR